MGSEGGIGFCGLLTLIFITLKLCSVITWGWLWVLAPMWIPLAVMLSIVAVIIAVAACIGLIKLAVDMIK